MITSCKRQSQCLTGGDAGMAGHLAASKKCQRAEPATRPDGPDRFATCLLCLEQVPRPRGNVVCFSHTLPPTDPSRIFNLLFPSLTRASHPLFPQGQRTGVTPTPILSDFVRFAPILFNFAPILSDLVLLQTSASPSGRPLLGIPDVCQPARLKII